MSRRAFRCRDRSRSSWPSQCPLRNRNLACKSMLCCRQNLLGSPRHRTSPGSTMMAAMRLADMQSLQKSQTRLGQLGGIGLQLTLTFLTFAFRWWTSGMGCPSPVPLARVANRLLEPFPSHFQPHGDSAFVPHRGFSPVKQAHEPVNREFTTTMNEELMGHSEVGLFKLGFQAFI